MKKVGLVTWYDRGPNYGTVLQAYALQKNIECFGYNCEIINYKNLSMVKKIKRMILLKIYLMIFRRKVFKRNSKISKWIKNNLKITKKITKYSELEKIEREYDAFVCGSDQIWSTAEERIEPFYYLQFTNYDKRISYAPSIGKDNIGNTVKEKFIEYVNGIKFLSVREKRAAEVIEQETGREAKVVLDPTLLLERKYWENMIENVKIKEEQPYVFVYFLTKNTTNYEKVRELAKNENLKIISTTQLYGENGNDIPLDPLEFLKYIKNAEYIITDSFHGTIFSIIFSKKVIIFKRHKDNTKMSQNSRIYNLLKMLGMETRLVTESNTLFDIAKKEIDYSTINKKIEEKKIDSRKFLEEAILNASK